MRFLICLLLAGLTGAPLAAGQVEGSRSATEVLERPLLTFDVIEIPGAGVAEGISGDVEILEEESGWTALSSGRSLLDGTKLRVGAGATLIIRFSATERIEFRPAEKERWVILEASRE